MPSETERVWMRTTTKGGETYTLDLGVHDWLNATAYLTRALSGHQLLKVAPDTYVAEDAIAKVEFERTEVR